VIIDHGRLVRAAPLSELSGPPAVSVRTSDPARLRAHLHAAGIALATHPSADSDVVIALDTTPEAVGRLVAAAGIVVYELRLVAGSLEDSFFTLTGQPAGGHQS